MVTAERNLEMMVFDRQQLFCREHIDIVQVLKVLRQGSANAVQIVECLFGCSAIDIEEILLRQISRELDKVNRRIGVIASCLKRVQDCPADSFPSEFMIMFPDCQEHEIIVFLQSERSIAIQRHEELTNISRLCKARKRFTVRDIDRLF